MKKSILKTSVFVFLLCSSILANAQIEKGMKVLSATASFSSKNSSTNDSLNNNNAGNKSINSSFNPSIGYFVNDKWCLGISVPLSYYTGKNFDNVNSYKSHGYNFGLSPYARYYIRFVNKFYGFINGSLNVGLNKNYNQVDINYKITPSTIITNSNNGYRGAVVFNFGLAYFVSPKFALTTSIVGASLDYEHLKQIQEGNNHYTTKTSNLSTSLALSGFNLGLGYYFK